MKNRSAIITALKSIPAYRICGLQSEEAVKHFRRMSYDTTIPSETVLLDLIPHLIANDFDADQHEVWWEVKQLRRAVQRRNDEITKLNEKSRKATQVARQTPITVFVAMNEGDERKKMTVSPPLSQFDALCEILLGEKLPYAVKDGMNGDIVIPANSKLTKARLRRLVGLNANHVRFDNAEGRFDVANANEKLFAILNQPE